jgi:hypothetical protein
MNPFCFQRLHKTIIYHYWQAMAFHNLYFYYPFLLLQQLLSLVLAA